MASGTSFYVNGQPVASTLVGSDAEPATIDGPVWVGHLPGDRAETQMSGHINDVRVYSKALSASEIADIYDKTLSLHSA